MCSGAAGLTVTFGLIGEIDCAVGRFGHAIRALASETFGRKHGPRGDTVVSERVGYL